MNAKMSQIKSSSGVYMLLDLLGVDSRKNLTNLCFVKLLQI